MTTTSDDRPLAVLAMMPVLGAAAFTPEQRVRLDALVRIVDDEPLASFDDPRAEALLADAEIIIGHWGCPTVDERALDMAPELRLLAYGAGSVKERNTVTPAVFDRGVVVTSAAAANAVPVAEYTLAVILLANKGAFLSREWLRDPDGVDARRPRPVGNYAKRIGLIGASFVGRLLVELLRPFEVEVVVSDPFLTPAEAAGLGVAAVTLDELLSTADVVSVHAPLLPSTEDMIGRRELALMKDGAVLINTARGRIVVTDDLIAELQTGRISAVLDVTWPEPLPAGSPLLSLPNAFVTPHIAGTQGSEMARLADHLIDEIERYRDGRPPRYPVTAADLDRIA